MIRAQVLARGPCRRRRHSVLVAGYLAVLAALISREVCAQQQSAPVKVEEVAHEGVVLQAPNNFSLALDAADHVLVGGASSGNVLRIAPRGDLGRQGDAPCVAEILSATRALQDGHASHTPCPANLPGPGFAFGGPKGIAVSSDGAVYVTGTGGQPNRCDNIVRIGPDGTIDELVNRDDLGFGDWNPGGIALDEGSGDGIYVYATGPTTVPGSIPTPGATVRINPDRTSQQILAAGGQGVVVDRTGNVYVAQTNANQVTVIPDARSGVCGAGGKQCPALIANAVTVRCDNHETVTLSGPYALALVGDVLYVTGQKSNNVLRALLTPDDPLDLPPCVDEIFSDAAGSLLGERLRRWCREQQRHLDQAAGTRHDRADRPGDHQRSTEWAQQTRSAGARLAGQCLCLRQHGGGGRGGRFPHPYSDGGSEADVWERRFGQRRGLRLRPGLLLLPGLRHRDPACHLSRLVRSSV
jgi:hypothetical protein